MVFSLEDILKYKSNNPEIFNINKHKKKYGFKIKFWSKKMDNCEKYYSWWKYAFIKKPERILPERWPVYYKKQKVLMFGILKITSI